MLALWLEDRRLRLRDDVPIPEPPPGEALVRVVRTGICNTDIELTRGYYPFTAATRVRARSILFASVTSSWQARTVPPFLARSAAARSPLAASRDPSTTSYPRPASWRHTSSPIPRFAPVTSATGGPSRPPGSPPPPTGPSTLPARCRPGRGSGT